MDPRRLKLRLLLPALGLLLLGVRARLSRFGPPPAPPRPDPEAIAAAALLSVRDQGRLVPFSARFVVGREREREPSRPHRPQDFDHARNRPLRSRPQPGCAARASPGTRRAGRSTVTLPPLELSGPEIDLNQVQEYSEGGLVMALAGSEKALDRANRRSAQDELMRQARAAGADAAGAGRGDARRGEELRAAAARRRDRGQRRGALRRPGGQGGSGAISTARARSRRGCATARRSADRRHPGRAGTSGQEAAAVQVRLRRNDGDCKAPFRLSRRSSTPRLLRPRSGHARLSYRQ